MVGSWSGTSSSSCKKVSTCCIAADARDCNLRFRTGAGGAGAGNLGGWSKVTWAEAGADAGIVSTGAGRLKGLPREEAGALAMLDDGPGIELDSLKC